MLIVIKTGNYEQIHIFVVKGGIIADVGLYIAR